MEKISRPSNRSTQKDMAKVRQVKNVGQELGDTIIERYRNYLDEFGLGQVAAQMDSQGHVGQNLPKESPQQARVAELQAQLRQKTAEAEQLRSDVLEKKK